MSTRSDLGSTKWLYSERLPLSTPVSTVSTHRWLHGFLYTVESLDTLEERHLKEALCREGNVKTTSYTYLLQHWYGAQRVTGPKPHKQGDGRASKALGSSAAHSKHVISTSTTKAALKPQH